MKSESNTIEGVLPYIAPEVLRKYPYTKKSDVYSVGMIMWELATGKRPFSNEKHDFDLALSILAKENRPQIPNDVPSFYAEVMKSCWNSDPDKRPDSSQLIDLFETLMMIFKDDDVDRFSKSNNTNNNNPSDDDGIHNFNFI